MLKHILLSIAVGLGWSPVLGQGVVTPQMVTPVPVSGGSLPLGGYWGMGVPVVPQVRYPSYYQGYFDAGIGPCRCRWETSSRSAHAVFAERGRHVDVVPVRTGHGGRGRWRDGPIG